MRRFIMNRWWAFILVLLMGVTGGLVAPRTSHADGTGWIADSGDGTFVPPVPNPVNGDPDCPSSNSAGTSAKAGSGLTNSGRLGTASATSVGDARLLGQTRILMQVRLALRLLKGYYLRF